MKPITSKVPITLKLISKAEFIKYDELLRLTKHTLDSSINLSKSIYPSKKEWDTGRVLIKHSGGESGYMDIEQKNIDLPKYRFVMFVKEFAVEPLCRFDSIGHTHENRDPHQPLSHNHVPTPHFHQYDQSGQIFAFQTPSVINRHAVIVGNIDEGWREMCTQYSILDPTRERPRVYEARAITTTKVSFDPHETVDFKV